MRAILDGRCVLATSDAILNEVAGVLSRSKFKVNRKEVRAVMPALIFPSYVKSVKSGSKAAAEDPDDDAITSTAYGGKADCSVRR